MHFMQKFKMVAKMVGKQVFDKLPDDSANTLEVKNLVEITHSGIISNKCIFCIYAEFQDGHIKWRANDFLIKIAK